MVKFGMNNTLLTFQGQYFKYGGSNGLFNNQDQCLMIGGYKSDWVPDLVAAFILENTKKCSKEPSTLVFIVTTSLSFATQNYQQTNQKMIRRFSRRTK